MINSLTFNELIFGNNENVSCYLMMFSVEVITKFNYYPSKNQFPVIEWFVMKTENDFSVLSAIRLRR